MLEFPTESVHALRTLTDFGLLVLIWLVQLIIYPSFRYTRTEDFQTWHGRYTFLISLLVVPLMLGQAALVLIQWVLAASWPVIASAVLLVLVWLNTFLQAVPTHTLLSRGENIPRHVEHLIKVNWIRTLLWTVVFILGLFARN